MNEKRKVLEGMFLRTINPKGDVEYIKKSEIEEMRIFEDKIFIRNYDSERVEVDLNTQHRPTITKWFIYLKLESGSDIYVKASLVRRIKNFAGLTKVEMESGKQYLSSYSLNEIAESLNIIVEREAEEFKYGRLK